MSLISNSAEAAEFAAVPCTAGYAALQAMLHQKLF
jgi:hypothetical protein